MSENRAEGAEGRDYPFPGTGKGAHAGKERERERERREERERGHTRDDTTHIVIRHLLLTCCQNWASRYIRSFLNSQSMDCMA